MDGQAFMLGVQLGWRVVKIDDEVFSKEKLNSKVADAQEYTLTFFTQVMSAKNVCHVVGDSS